jgi:MFS family permease
LGLCVGASSWGIASDILGRRVAFNTTLFLAGAFGLAAGGAPNWIGYVLFDKTDYCPFSWLTIH